MLKCCTKSPSIFQDTFPIMIMIFKKIGKIKIDFKKAFKNGKNDSKYIYNLGFIIRCCMQ